MAHCGCQALRQISVQTPGRNTRGGMQYAKSGRRSGARITPRSTGVRQHDARGRRTGAGAPRGLDDLVAAGAATAAARQPIVQLVARLNTEDIGEMLRDLAGRAAELQQREAAIATRE